MLTTRRQSLLIAIAAVAAAIATAPTTAASAPSSGEVRTSAKMGPLSMMAVKKSGAPVRGDADEPSISANGRYVTYTSKNLGVIGLPNNGAKQVFRHDRKTGRTVLVSATPGGAPGAEDSWGATVSADGGVVVFQTYSEDLLPDESSELHGSVILARDVTAHGTTLVSRTATGDVPNASSWGAIVTEDGSVVSFRTDATDITGVKGAVVFDRSTDTSSAVTVDTASGPMTLEQAYISGNGRWLAFASANPTIVPGDDNDAADSFLLDRETGGVTLVSRSADGTPANESSRFVVAIDSWSSPKPFASSDGSRVAFMSDATDLAGAELAVSPDYTQAYAYDATTGSSELVSVMPDGSPADDIASATTISPNGRYVAVSTQALLAGGQGVLGPKIFVRDLERDDTRAASDNQWGVAPGLGGSKPHVVFTTYDPLVPEDADRAFDVYHRRVW